MMMRNSCALKDLP